MNILLSACACEPAGGSGSELGWNLVEQIARHHEVWVLTASGNRPAIEAELARRPLARAHFCYVDGLSWRPGRARRSAAGHLWQLRAYVAARRLQRAVGFDVAHQIGAGRYAMSSLLALLPVPLVWGPLAGGEPAPEAFRPRWGSAAWLDERLRAARNSLVERDPLVGLTARRSAIVLAATRATAERLGALGARRVELRGEAGLRAEQIHALARLPAPPATPIRFASFGGPGQGQGLALGLRAFAAAAIPEAEYLVVAEGRQRGRLQAIARAAGLGERVRFCDGERQGGLRAALGACHALVHPSLEDADGRVCLEAMAAGRPVICLERGAPATQVTAQTGIKVAAATPEQVVRDLAEAMRRLAADPELRTRLGDAGRARARRVYDWNAKGRCFVHLYEQVAAPTRAAIATEPVPYAGQLAIR